MASLRNFFSENLVTRGFLNVTDGAALNGTPGNHIKPRYGHTPDSGPRTGGPTGGSADSNIFSNIYEKNYRKIYIAKNFASIFWG